MSDMDRIVYFAGKLVADMTRQELIDALNVTARIAAADRRDHARQLDILGAASSPQA